jgi:hypothetical protein
VGALAGILGGGWAGRSSFSLFSNRLSSGSGSVVAGQHKLAAISGRQVHEIQRNSWAICNIAFEGTP